MANQKLPLDEEMIPTKIPCLKGIYKRQACRLGFESIFADSEHGYNVNADIHSNRRTDCLKTESLGVTGNLVEQMTKYFQDLRTMLYSLIGFRHL